MKVLLATALVMSATLAEQLFESNRRILRAPTHTIEDSEWTEYKPVAGSNIPNFGNEVIEPAISVVPNKVVPTQVVQPTDVQPTVVQPTIDPVVAPSTTPTTQPVIVEPKTEPASNLEPVPQTKIVEPEPPITGPIFEGDREPEKRQEESKQAANVVVDEPLPTNVPIVIPSDSGQTYNPSLPVYNGNCWKRAYSRGAGKTVHSCPDGYEKQGLFCYPICKEGYKGVLADCQQHCPDGWRDDGLWCHKPEDLIRKNFSSKAKCEKHDNKPCEQEGILGWYEKCPRGYHKVGWAICSKNCPEGMDDIGISCAKHIYLRECETLTCAPQEQFDGFFCYPPCQPGTIADGMNCWFQCPPGTLECGAACLQPHVNCATYITGIVTSGVASVVDIATGAVAGSNIVSRAVTDVAAIATELSLPNCPNYY